MHYARISVIFTGIRDFAFTGCVLVNEPLAAGLVDAMLDEADAHSEVCCEHPTEGLLPASWMPACRVPI